MASDGLWVSATAPKKSRGPGDYVRRKYYHYTLWTGIYMMDKNEARAINAFVLIIAAALVRSMFILFSKQLV